MTTTQKAPRRATLRILISLASLIIIGWIISDSLSSGITVTRADHGDAWPFTVDRVVLDCDALGYPIARPQGPNASGTWALTGAAQAHGYPSIDPYWRDNPNAPGTKVPLTRMINLALEQCR